MFNSKRVKGAWWAYTALAVLLVAGCVSAVSEESGGSSPASDDSGGAGSGSPPSSPDSSSPPPPVGGGVSATGVGETDVVQVGEENGGGEASSGVDPLELAGSGDGPIGLAGGGVVAVEVRVSEEGLERLRRVLGEDKLTAVLETAESWAESELLRTDSGVLLGRLAGENGFLTEEGLGRLAERRSGGELALEADFYSEEVLAEYANESGERMAGPLDGDVWDFEGRFADEYSDEDVKGLAFYERAAAEVDNGLWEDNDRSTPVGAFCWAVLNVSYIPGWTETGIRSGFRAWESRNLKVWHLEREAARRGIELEWETPPLDANRVFRRVLLEATTPEIRSVVFAPGLPPVLRPAAEALYNLYDELLALPVRRIRPRVGELSEYRRLQELTEEEIAEIWPDELEIDYREEDNAKYENAVEVLRDDAVRELLNAECEERLVKESACPPWEVPEETGSLLSIMCSDMLEDMLEDIDPGPGFSCPLFYKVDTREASFEDLLSECTIDEEAAERFREQMDELMERDMERRQP